MSAFAGLGTYGDARFANQLPRRLVEAHDRPLWLGWLGINARSVTSGRVRHRCGQHLHIEVLVGPAVEQAVLTRRMTAKLLDELARTCEA